MRAYLDSSAFAKRFVEEPGSDAVEAVCGEATALGLSVLCAPEIISALSRRRLGGELSSDQYHTAKAHLVADIEDAILIDLTPSVIASSIRVLESSRVRTLDALHVASAIEWEAEIFVTSDRRQLRAGRSAGLKVQAV